jgi:hypothetical protein
LAIPKSPTTERPSTDTTLTMLVDPSRMPAVTATASVVQGGESLFARVEAYDMPKERSRHSAYFALIGPRVAVLAVLDQLRAAVHAAQSQPAESGESR